MSVSGLCQVCQAGEAEHQCVQCGALVCDEHFDRGGGVCVQCAAGTQV